ncbi:sigma-70 family RNA polymerase sigma factor [Clostridium fungisolvens]|uniref:ECF RNA polymerase sigma factor SigW n=1 Tax=Clostridium fungisolvens TaxID=1604897 RepID=A0A6V8SBP1_9CLOT|nr:sigma-70 family RNA polymerase sigma factor [Clostridium fungisolvens]GFP74649.1 ECF RNA polymerase sigma factor SigW [Clostridium fungisolvens]
MLLNSSRLNKALEVTDDVRLAKKGNKEAFCRIIESNKNQLYRIAKGIVHFEADIEDVFQEATLKAWLQIKTLKKDEYFKTWLIRILINECNTILRKRKSVITLEEVSFTESEDLNINEKLDLWNALNSLSDEYRTVVVLFYYEDLPYKDIAAILKISEGTVKSRLSRAKAKLEEILNFAVKGE